MKRGTPDHPKVRDLAQRLKVPRYAAAGLLEMLWHFTARYAARGDIGRWSDLEIAASLGWDGDPAVLIGAFVGAGWLDKNATHRLVVHDWHDHADEATKKHLARTGKGFATKPGPSTSRLRPSVYILQAESSRHIKIGFTESTVEARVAALQTGCPERLLILCSFRGTHKDELDLHRQFSAYALSGEWFKDCDEIRSYVRQRQTAAASVRQRRPAVAVAVAVAEPVPLPEPEPTAPPPPRIRIPPPSEDSPLNVAILAACSEIADLTGKDDAEVLKAHSMIPPRRGDERPKWITSLDSASEAWRIRTMQDLHAELSRLKAPPPPPEDEVRGGLPARGPWEHQ